MTEVLYHAKKNKLFLFNYKYQFDPVDNMVVIVLISPKKYKNIGSKDLVHIGWL